MACSSDIEWTESTWNPVTGCTKISPGCKNCYAQRMAYRLQAMGQNNYRNGFEVTLHEHVLNVPYKWKKPRMIFVNSMSDLFHKSVSMEFIERVFEVMKSTPQHQYQILTKRSGRLSSISKNLYWPHNVWMGVTVESEEYTYRINHLRNIDARVKFISIEPLLGPIHDLKLNGIDWAILGGESGPHARPMKKEWALEIRNICVHKGVPFFFKQWGGVNKKAKGRHLDGELWDEMPRIPNPLSI